VKLFLGTRVLIAAIGSDRGTARFIIEEAAARGWELITADYCVEEAQRNWAKLRQSPAVSAYIWKTVIFAQDKNPSRATGIEQVPCYFPRPKTDRW